MFFWCISRRHVVVFPFSLLLKVVFKMLIVQYLVHFKRKMNAGNAVFCSSEYFFFFLCQNERGYFRKNPASGKVLTV